MAKQTGDSGITGTIGDYIYYKTRYGNLIRRKGSLDKERVMTDPAFTATRAAGSEFGRAGKASGLVRNAVIKFCPFASNGDTHSRLSKLFGTLIREDKTHEKGERQLLPENIALFRSFEWIENQPLSKSFWAQCKGSMSPENKLTISMPGFSPKRDLYWPANATHVELTLVCFSADFPNHLINCEGAKSGKLVKSNVAMNLLLECQITPLPESVTMAGLGVEYFENDKALKEGAVFGIVG